MAEIRKDAVKWINNPTDLAGPEVKVGDKAPTDWQVTGNDMKPISGADMAGKKRIVVTVPSVDTPVCDTEVRRFNQSATDVPGVEILVASMDLPFAQKRWCGAAGVDKVRTASDYKDRTFGTAWGVLAPANGLMARAVFVIGEDDVVKHAEYCEDIVNEPDYEAALAAARAL